MKNKPTYWIASVDHALRLAIILHVEGPLTVSAAAARLGVARSTAHRLLSMLVYRDFAVQNKDRSYRAGPLLAMGPTDFEHAAQLRAIAMPHLRRLTDHLRESTQLQILSGSHVRFVASVEAARLPRVENREGMVHAAHRSSAGKAMLAQLPEDRLERTYSDMQDLQFLDLPARAKFNTDLKRIRERGFAINLGETEQGLAAIGCALQWNGGAAAGISVSMPMQRYDESKLNRVVAVLHASARGLERDLVAVVGP